MELHQLRYFVAVAEAGSISRAAKRCNIAQPSLSQQIKRLEESLSKQLFDRIGRGTTLTEAGRALLPRARRILAEVREAQDSIQSDIAQGKGRLSVGAISTIAPYLLPPVLKRFSKQFPECDLNLRDDLTPSLVDAVVDNQVDCAIVSTPIDHDRVELEVLGEEALLVAASDDFDLPEPVSIGDLDNQPAVVLHEMHCLGQQIAGFCSSHRTKQRILCHSTQLTTVQALVGLGLGISLVPEMVARADRSKSRRYLPLTDAEPRREIAVIWRRGRSRSSLAERMVEMVRNDLQRGVHRYAA